jgi:hypothetical protein
MSNGSSPDRPQPRGDIREPEHADFLGAIWILASNDENSIITYRGLRFRLGITEEYARALVCSRPELFRLGVPAGRLANWKERMRAGPEGPSWLKSVTGAEKRAAAIESLSVNDCFRSQFRAEDAAPRSSLEIIEWGLSHIDRVRNSIVAWDEGIAKSWHMWLTMSLTLVSIIAQVLIAALKQVK